MDKLNDDLNWGENIDESFEHVCVVLLVDRSIEIANH